MMRNKKKKKKVCSMEGRKGDPKIPEGNLGWPLIGETLDFVACGYSSRPVSFMEKRKGRYGKVFKTNIIGTPIIVSTDPDVNKAILQNHGTIFVTAYPKSITQLLGNNSILQINGAPQRRLHALIARFLKSTSFKAKITRDIETSVKAVLAPWSDMQLVQVQEQTKKITFEILIKVLLSVGPGEALDFMKREFEELLKGLICLPINLPGTRLYKSLKAKERLTEKVKKIVEEREWIHKKSTVETSTVQDMVDVLLGEYGENGVTSETHSRTLDFISGNIIEMMIPGEETVPMAMTLAVKFLSDNPVALTHLVEENMDLRRRKDESSDGFGWTDYMSLRFTQNVINETLRLANIINGVWRKALKDIEIKGYLIPKGWCVLASFISVHMDENNYDDPHVFNPWRWETIDAGLATNGSFTPFGGGQRLCPGLELSKLEISIFLHHLVTRFRWIAETDEIISFPTVRMKKKLPIKIMPI